MVEVEVVAGGEQKILDLCEWDYARLSGGGWFSLWESVFEEFFFPRRWQDREAVDIGEECFPYGQGIRPLLRGPGTPPHRPH